jgi:hypothetical protein
LAREHANLMTQSNVFEYDVSSRGEKKPEKGKELSELKHGEPFGKAFNTKGVAWRMRFTSSRAASAKATSIMEAQ